MNPLDCALQLGHVNAAEPESLYFACRIRTERRINRHEPSRPGSAIGHVNVAEPEPLHFACRSRSERRINRHKPSYKKIKADNWQE
jgi:hypothetical protein